MLLPIVARIVTDSNAMLPAELATRFDILQVSLTIVVDGQAHPEHELDLSEFYDQLRSGKPITTAAPSPGEVLATYRRALAAGAESILSIHVGSNQSATISAARLAAREVDAPVTIVDTGTASFIEGCCVWRAAEMLATSATVDEAARAASAVAVDARSVFTIGEISRATEGGRLVVREGAGVPVFASAGPEMHELDRVTSEAAAVALMTAQVAEHRGPLRVGIGHADAPGSADALERSLRALPNVTETIRYLVGPSVAAHAGAGTFGAVFHPI
jgi:DegV family protein with EDD domain